jgi:hypothetical protein
MLLDGRDTSLLLVRNLENDPSRHGLLASGAALILCDHAHISQLVIEKSRMVRKLIFP